MFSTLRFLLAATFVVSASLSAFAADHLNVILLITDDQGYGDVAAHGNNMIQTPNMDALGKQSVRFTNFHVDPTCAETRSALMTGHYSLRAGVWHTILGRSLLAKDQVTMADVFKANGYATGMFGKWHLGDNYPLRPEHRGFDTVTAHGGGGVGQTPDYFGNDYFDDTYFVNGKPTKFEGYCTDIWFSEATKFIEKNKAKPFFCYIATNAPHGPYLVAESYKQPYKEKGVGEPMASFYGMITNIDENIGVLRKKLAELGLDKNTAVIFMTDNGTAAGMRGNAKWPGFNAGMRGNKGSQFDGGHRVPCYVHLPGETSGREVSQLSAHFDLLPTLMELCDLEYEEDLSLDGISLAPWIKEKAPLVDRTLVVHSQRIDRPEKYRKTAVMTGKWRMVDGKQLYDMEADPGQQKDVASDNPEVMEELDTFYTNWWNALEDRRNLDVRIPIGAEGGNPTTLTGHDWHSEFGGVPWNQNHIRNDLIANGVWLLDVAEAGTYKFTLRSRIDESAPLAAEKASITIGGKTVQAEVDKGATAVTLEVDLPEGTADLKTELSSPKKRTRGAYYVEIERQ
jgi:arylsulfatase A-like enzyme